MDCTKTGKLILQLRKENHMTQKQLADIMNISDKTISKWERGLGCPDVTLLNELSDILGVNIEDILSGKLSTSEIQGGNMKRMAFYYCPDCGNVMTSTLKTTLTCCSRKLTPLIPNEPDENHSLIIEKVEFDNYITFSHPMTKDHYISFVACVSFDRVLLVKLYPEQNAEVRFPMMSSSKIYYYCTEHGFFENKHRR